MAKHIHEVVVFCGRTKVFRVLNLSTGTIYSMDFETPEEAVAAIEDGEKRSGCTVKRWTLPEVVRVLNENS